MSEPAEQEGGGERKETAAQRVEPLSERVVEPRRRLARLGGVERDHVRRLLALLPAAESWRHRGDGHGAWSAPSKVTGAGRDVPLRSLSRNPPTATSFDIRLTDILPQPPGMSD